MHVEGKQASLYVLNPPTAEQSAERRKMFAFSYLFDFLAQHYLWSTLAVLVVGGTIAIRLTVDRER